MASYGALLRKIPTSEINRLLRDCTYSRWAYFIDEKAGKVGVVFANDTTFGAYTIDDVPDPKLVEYGLEAIKDLKVIPDPKLLVLMAGQHQIRAAVFNDPMTVIEDEFLPTFSYAATQDWQQFLTQRHIAIGDDPRRHQRGRRIRRFLILAILAILLWQVLL